MASGYEHSPWFKCLNMICIVGSELVCTNLARLNLNTSILCQCSSLHASQGCSSSQLGLPVFTLQLQEKKIVFRAAANDPTKEFPAHATEAL